MPVILDPFEHPLHRESEELSFAAERAAKAGNSTAARQLYSTAGQLELRVARELGLDGSQAKLRSIFAVSSLTCLLRAARWNDTITAAHEFLAKPELLLPGSEPELEELLDDALRSRELASLLAADKADAEIIQLEVRLEGGQVRHGLAPTRLIKAREEVVEALTLRVADWRAGREFRAGGPSVFASRFAFFEAPARAGSYGIRFLIASQGQAGDEADVTPREAVRTLLELASRASEGAAAIRAHVGDPRYAMAFLRAFRDLAPDGCGVESVSFSSSMAGARRQAARFVPAMRLEFSRALAQIDEYKLDVHGVLKIVNLHKPRQITVVTDQDARYVFRLRPGEHDDTIGPKLNRRVRVIGRRARSAKGELNVADDVIVDES